MIFTLSTTAAFFSAQSRRVCCSEAMSWTVPSGGASTLAESACSPPTTTCPWASTKPGTSVLPSRSTSRVSGPLSFMTSLRRPTAMILPFATATASARIALSFIVRMGPPDQMVSAV